MHAANSHASVRLALVTVLVAAAALAHPLANSTASLTHTRHDGGETAAAPGGSPGTADGALPDDVSVFDEEYPGVANLAPHLRDALRRATTDAAAQGVEVRVNSGWRSANYQTALLRDAVAEHGSEAAARWVATPDTSSHVPGNAVDIGPRDAASWLSQHGADYGLCQIYRNEPWHYEFRPNAATDGCPDPYADPTADPRMQG